jgi:hypothetical protein
MKGGDHFAEFIYRIKLNPEGNIRERVCKYIQYYSNLFELDITHSPLKYNSLLFKSFMSIENVDPLKLPLQHRDFFLCHEKY